MAAGKRLHRGVHFSDRKKLKAALREQCELEYRQHFGFDFQSRRRPAGPRPKLETEAQALFAAARRTLPQLVEILARTDFAVCGPCTAYLAEHAPALRRLVRDEQWKPYSRWRQHSADRLSNATTWTIDVWGPLRPRLTNRMLAVISFLEGAPLPTATTVYDCIRLQQNAIRTALSRQRKPHTRS